MQKSINSILSSVNSKSEAFKALKQAGLKPWQEKNLHPHTWMKQVWQQGSIQDLNWVAKLQLTEPPVTLEGEDGYKEALENKAMFELAHDEEMGKRKAFLDKMTEKFVKGKEEEKEKKARKALKEKKLAYQAKIKKEKEEEKARKEAFKARAKVMKETKKEIKRVEKLDPNFRAKCKKYRDQRINALNTIEKAFEEHMAMLSEELRQEATKEYDRLVNICLMVTSKAMKKIMKSF